MSSPRIQIPPALVAEGQRLFEETNALRQDIAAVMGISPDALRRCSIEWGWKQRPRLSSVRATRPAGGTPGRFAARQRSLTHWLAPAFGEGRMLSADTDKIEALSLDRAALWDRVSKAPFLSVNEKRLAAGYGPAEGGDVLPSQQ